MSSFVPNCSSARSGVDEIKAKINDLSKDLDNFAPEHRSQVMVARLKQEKIRAMLSLAKAQHFLAEMDVLIADYNLQAVAEEFEDMKKERNNNITGMIPLQNLGSKEDKLVFSTEYSTGNSKPQELCCCTPLHTPIPTAEYSGSKERSTELTPKPTTQNAEPHRSHNMTKAIDIPTPKYIPTPINKIDGSTPADEVNKPTSKVKEPPSDSNKSKASKTIEPTSFKINKATTSKTYKASSSKTKEATKSMTFGATTSNNGSTFLAEFDLPQHRIKRKKRSKSKAKESKSKRHKSSHVHTPTTYAPAATTHASTATIHASAATTHASAATTHASTATTHTPAATTHAPAASSNAQIALTLPATSQAQNAPSHVHTETLHTPIASSYVQTASSHAPMALLYAQLASAYGNTASTHAPIASSHAHTALTHAQIATHVQKAPFYKSTVSSQLLTASSHASSYDCLKSIKPYKEKTLLNTSLSPIKCIDEAVQTYYETKAKEVQTDDITSKNRKIQTDEVKTLAKGVQTDNVVIVHVGSQTTRDSSPDIDDAETLRLERVPPMNSHSTAISLSKALQQIMSQKTSVLERLCPAIADVSEVLTQNDVLQKIELMIEDEEETVKESQVVKIELPDDEDIPNTSTEVLVNNLYKDIMDAKEKGAKGNKSKTNVTKKGLWKILDQC